MHIVGFEPGSGRLAGGVALLRAGRGNQSSALCAGCSSVDEAVAWVRAQLKGADLDGVGVHACLSWGTGEGGVRPMDEWLLGQGGCGRSAGKLVQGVAFGLVIRRMWPRAWMNETHPEVQATGLGIRGEMGEWVKDQFRPGLELELGAEEEGAALFSAWATWMGMRGLWGEDLMGKAGALVLPAGEVHLYWPAAPPIPAFPRKGGRGRR